MDSALLWIALPALAGFVYGWRKVSAAAATARRTARVELQEDSLTEVSGYIRGIQFGTAIRHAFVGGIAGFAVWAAIRIVLLAFGGEPVAP
jgi:hypothetical protein